MSKTKPNVSEERIIRSLTNFLRDVEKGKRSKEQEFKRGTPPPFNHRKTTVDIRPRNQAQSELIQRLEDPTKDIVFSTGPAGTGKTYLMTLFAIKQLREKNVKKIVIARPNVAVDDKDIGHLPGNIFEKMGPWVRPILDIFEEFYKPEEIQWLLEENILEICPIAFIRGRTFKNAMVLIDEAQGTTSNSLKAILTRIGEDSRMLITGDINQTDIGAANGLQDFLNRWEAAEIKSPRIDFIKFSHADIERHPVVEDILTVYGDTNKPHS